jgi:ElaA protein
VLVVIAKWSVCPWDTLDIETLYDLLSLREKVFVVEQKCFYQDADGLDREAIHVIGRDNAEHLIAYCRIYPQVDGWHIGRVLVDSPFRGQGLARLLMVQALTICGLPSERGPELHLMPMHLSAQCHLTDFYGSLGFEAVGAAYLEDGIPHQDMSRAPAFRTTEGGQHE